MMMGRLVSLTLNGLSRVIWGECVGDIGWLGFLVNHLWETSYDWVGRDSGDVISVPVRGWRGALAGEMAGQRAGSEGQGARGGETTGPGLQAAGRSVGG